MVEYKNKNRILALIMAVLLVIGAMPVYVAKGEDPARTPEPKEYTIKITVKDSESNPIEGAKVTYALTVGSGEGEVTVSNESVLTYENGIATITVTDTADLLSSISSENKAFLNFDVEKTGEENYASVHQTEEITTILSEEAYEVTTPVTLREGIPLKIKSEHGTVKVNDVPVAIDGTSYEGTAYVESGQKAVLTIEPDTGYKIDKVEKTEGEISTTTVKESDGKYTLESVAENTSVAVSYINTYTLKDVTDDEAKKGTVKFCADEVTESPNIDVSDTNKYKDELTVDANGTAYVVIKPDSGYRAEKITIKEESSTQEPVVETLTGPGDKVYKIENISDNIQITVDYVFLHTVIIDSSIANGRVEFVDNNGNVMNNTSLSEIDEGTTLKIKITPDAGKQVASVSVNDTGVNILGFSKDTINPDIITGEISVSGDEEAITITAVFETKKYEVSYSIVNSDENSGTVNISKTTVEHGSTVNITVTPTVNGQNGDYRIKSIKIGKKDADFSTIPEETITDNNNKGWTKADVEITQDTEIQVTFVRVYTATVTYNKNTGTVETNMTNGDSSTESVDGNIKTIKAVINKDGKLEVNVKAVDNSGSDKNNIQKYAISAIKVNNEDPINMSENTTAWSKEFAATQDYEIIIEFTEYKYTVKSAVGAAGGNIGIYKADAASNESSSELKVKIGDSAKIKITSDEGKNINFENVKINGQAIASITEPTGRGTQIAVSGIERDGASISFTISNIKENIEVSAEFTDIPVSDAEFGTDITISESLNKFETDALFTYVYSNEAEVKLTTTKAGIKVYGYTPDSTDKKSVLLGGDFDVQNVDIAKGTVITGINIFDADENGSIGQWEKINLSGKNISVVSDTSRAEVEFSVNNQVLETMPIYNNNVAVDVSVTEKEAGKYSGIASIKYTIVPDYTAGMEENADSLEFTEITVTNIEKESLNIEVNADSFNSSNTAIIVIVKDKAGNETKAVQKLDIDKTAPVITVEYFDIAGSADGIAIENSDVNHNNRKAVITITERTNHFKAENVVISATKNSDAYSVGNVTWTEKKSAESPDMDVHMAEISFSSDGNYTFAVEFKDTADNKAAAYNKAFAVDKVAPAVKAEIANPNETGIYNKNVVVNLSSEDITSNISKVIYTVKGDNVETKTAEVAVGNSKTWEYALTIDKTQYNVDNINVSLTAVDVCGRTSEPVSVTFSIDNTAPEITITGIDNGSYYQKAQTAIITIKERTSHFDADKVDIKVSTDKVNNGDYSISGIWQTTEGSTPDEAVHQITVSLNPDAVYKITVDYTDDAENKAVTAESTITIDETNPVGSINANGFNWLNNFVITNRSVVLSHTENDITSGVRDVSYYKSNSTTKLTQTELNNLSENQWKSFNSSIAVEGNDCCIVYMRVRDNAGNILYTSTSGIIVDTKSPEETVQPSVTVTPEQPVNGIYNRNVNVAVEVTDPTAGGTFSGLKSVTFNVYNMGTVTQSGTLYSFDKNNPTKAELLQNFSGNITVDAVANNSNDVVIEVTAEDNAGNTFTKTASIKIDVTQPSINISYNNNTPDSNSYYKEDRTATIVVTERNFKSEDVRVTITNTDETIPQLSNWTKSEGTGNGDNTTYTATVTYSADGDYTFAISYADMAGNESTDVVFENGTQNPTEFTIDKTLPVMDIQSTDGQGNAEYIQDSRQVTITVTEHNFTADRVSIMVNEATVAVEWNNNGDIHTATYTFTEEGEYQNFNVTLTDMAGNQGENKNLDTFYIDTAAPELNVEVESSENDPYDDEFENDENGDKRKIYVFKKDNITVSFSDTYYLGQTVELYRTSYGNAPEQVKTDNYEIKTVNGKQVITIPLTSFENSQENDGLYQLNVKVTDKSGRETTQTVYFTINRFGSVYIYDQAIINMQQNQYTQKVTDDFVITEYNADKLEGPGEITVTKDGTKLTLEEDKDYTIAPESKSVGWYQYKYTIKKEVFTEDGVYKLSVASKDAAENNSESVNANMVLDSESGSVSNKEILFYVDTTKPEITSINGMGEAIFNENEHQVSFSVFDSIGLKDGDDAVKVEINGKAADVQLTEGENNAINRTYAFTMAEGTNQTVSISVTDKAGNTRSTSDSDFNPGYAFENEITVSTNFFIRWFANKPLFFGSIGGTAAVAGGGTTALVLRRRKLRLKVKGD